MLLLALAALVVSPDISVHSPIDSSIVWVQGGPFRLKVAVYEHEPRDTRPVTLVIVLHGDAPFNKPDYQDRFARAVAQAYPNVVAAAILRPGYTDPEGHTSDGVRGQATGDSYNAENTDALAEATLRLREQFHATRTVLVGHSGGAALTANILGRHPDLAAAAVLVSCPCDVAAWRQHMFQKTKFAGFQGPLATLSPIDLADSLPTQASLVLIVGDQDDVAPPSLTRAYAERARAHGATITLVTLPGEGHEILLHPRVLEALAPLLH